MQLYNLSTWLMVVMVTLAGSPKNSGIAGRMVLVVDGVGHVDEVVMFCWWDTLVESGVDSGVDFDDEVVVGIDEF